MDEEDFTLKERKNARKRTSQLDRSKFKKTDLKKWTEKQQRSLQEKMAKKEVKEGRVLLIKPEEILVDSHGDLIVCSIGGIVKKEVTRLKNLMAVGDFVLFEPDNHRIVSVQPRKTILSRSDHLRQRKEHIIAANIDQVLITVSIHSPPLKASLIDRYLIATLKGGMSPVIIINKIDLLELGSDEALLYEELLRVYCSLDIPVIPISIVTGQGIDTLQDQMKGKASVFSGQSGVGKSSLINAMTGLSLPIGKMLKSLKGSHMTTQARLVTLPFGGWCIDTPGIRSFGIWDLNEQDLKDYFPDIFSLSAQCRFPNCSHTHEPDCHVIASVKEEKLSFLRYESYLKLLATVYDPRMLREGE